MSVIENWVNFGILWRSICNIYIPTPICCWYPKFQIFAKFDQGREIEIIFACWQHIANILCCEYQFSRILPNFEEDCCVIELIFCGMGYFVQISARMLRIYFTGEWWHITFWLQVRSSVKKVFSPYFEARSQAVKVVW